MGDIAPIAHTVALWVDLQIPGGAAQMTKFAMNTILVVATREHPATEIRRLQLYRQR